MINSPMFIHKDKPEKMSEEERLRKKLLLLIQEIETLRAVAEEKIRQLETSVEFKMSELENRLKYLEDRLNYLTLVLSSLEPSKRVN